MIQMYICMDVIRICWGFVITKFVQIFSETSVTNKNWFIHSFSSYSSSKGFNKVFLKWLSFEYGTRSDICISFWIRQTALFVHPKGIPLLGKSSTFLSSIALNMTGYNVTFIKKTLKVRKIPRKAFSNRCLKSTLTYRCQY